MSYLMGESDRNRLRAAILRLCADESHNMREILATPEVARFAGRFGERIVKETTYALANTGLLARGGETKNSVYLATPLGKAAADTYEVLGHSQNS